MHTLINFVFHGSVCNFFYGPGLGQIYIFQSLHVETALQDSIQLHRLRIALCHIL